jgi:hypothetical protein
MNGHGPDEPETAAYADSAAALIGLPLAPEHRPGVIENLTRIRELTGALREFPLPADIEAAPVFEP